MEPARPTRLAPFLVAMAAWLSATRPAAASDVQDLYQNLTGGCWACDALTQFCGMGLDAADGVFAALAGDTRTILGLLMAVWMLFVAGRTFLPFGPSGSPGSLWNEAARKILQFSVVLAFLQTSQGFWDYVFMPLISTGVGLSIDLYSATQGQACAVAPVTSGLAGAKAALGAIACPLAGIQDAFTKGLLIGVAIVLGGGWHNWVDFITVSGWAGHLVQIASGLLLALVFAFGFLMYPLLFMDCLVRAVIIAMFAPLAIAASLFVPTRTIPEKAAWNLAQSALTVIFATVVVGLMTSTLTYVYGTIGTSDGTQISDWSSLIGQLESGGTGLSIFDLGFWRILTAGVIAVFMLRQAGAMAAAFTGAPSGDFSGAASGMATIADYASQLVDQLEEWGGANAKRKATAKAVARRARRSGPSRLERGPTEESLAREREREGPA